MSLGGFYRRRRPSAAGALIGVLLYVALIPLHFVSQTTTALLKAELGDAYQVLCHGSAEPGEASGAHSKPAIPGTRCPYCQGLASFHIAFPALEALSLTPVLAWASAPRFDKQDAASQSRPIPQSRGPPILRI
jgi:Protein of unknown function (DUF2946)